MLRLSISEYIQLNRNTIYPVECGQNKRNVKFETFKKCTVADRALNRTLIELRNENLITACQSEYGPSLNDRKSYDNQILFLL